MNTPLINPIFIYLVDVSGTVKTLSSVVATILIIGSCIVRFILFIEQDSPLLEDDLDIKMIKTCKKCLIAGFVILLIAILVPSSDTIKEMIICQNLTIDNITYGRDYILETIEKIVEIFK